MSIPKLEGGDEVCSKGGREKYVKWEHQGKNPWVGHATGMSLTYSFPSNGPRGPTNFDQASTHSTHLKLSPSAQKPNPHSLSPPLSTKSKLPSIPNPRSQSPLLARPLNQRNPVNYKKLIDAKLQTKIAKGLCFRCDAKFSPGHRCQNTSLQVLLVQDEPSREEEGQLPDTNEYQEEKIQEVAELYVNSMVGLSAPKTRSKGK